MIWTVKSSDFLEIVQIVCFPSTLQTHTGAALYSLEDNISAVNVLQIEELFKRRDKWWGCTYRAAARVYWYNYNLKLNQVLWHLPKTYEVDRSNLVKMSTRVNLMTELEIVMVFLFKFIMPPFGSVISKIGLKISSNYNFR